MANALAKAWNVLRTEGFGALLNRALGHERRVMLFVEKDLTLGDEVPFLPRNPYVTRFLEPNELNLLEPLITAERLAGYRERFARGMKLIGILSADESECLGWIWTTDRPYYEPFDNATYLPVPGDVLHIDGEVAEEKRGRGVAFAAFPLLWSYWRKRGFTKCHCTIDELNKASLKIHDRMNYSRGEHLVVRTLLGFKWARCMGRRVVAGNRAQ